MTRQLFGAFPGSHPESTLETFDFNQADKGHNLFSAAAKHLLSEWHGDQFAGLYLHGNPGTGKTHAAVGMARALLNSGAEVHSYFVPELNHDMEGVSGWRKPRIFDRYGSNNQLFTVTEKVAEDGSKITTQQRLSVDEQIEHERGSVFPAVYGEGIERNPRTVLLLDDYKPRYKLPVRAAIEAAADAGALVIITSNFPGLDDLAIPVQGELSIREPMIYGGNPSPEDKAQLEAYKREARAVHAASLSRIANGMLSIEFTGHDHRAPQSFWSNMITPELLS